MTNIEPILRSNLLRLARAYAFHRDIALATVSRGAHGESTFFDMLMEQENDGERTDNRGSFTARKYDQLVEWFRSNWPKGKPFPKLQHPKKARA